MIFRDLGTVSPQEGMIAEEQMFNSPGSPSLIIYTRDRPTVSLGRFNDECQSINRNFIDDRNIEVIRRISGGSAIYCDSGQITFSVAVDRDRFGTKEESYRFLCECLTETLKILGADASYKPVNDVLVNGNKISGCAQYRNRARLLHHGSLILSLDRESMDGSLIPLKERKYGMTSLEGALGYIPERERICEAFREGFADL